jgi:catechol 2,3-dioxygenase-like lactoylglutathione lyase family enzyme
LREIADPKASTVFYRDMLGLALVATLPAQANWNAMRFLRAAGDCANHHDIALIANATLPPVRHGEAARRGLFRFAFEVGIIAGPEAIAQRLKAADAFVDNAGQPIHLSVYGRDPDGLALEIVWRVPNGDGTCEQLWRRALDF